MLEDESDIGATLLPEGCMTLHPAPVNSNIYNKIRFKTFFLRTIWMQK
jgi:hypothetical protein